MSDVLDSNRQPSSGAADRGFYGCCSVVEAECRLRERRTLHAEMDDLS